MRRKKPNLMKDFKLNLKNRNKFDLIDIKSLKKSKKYKNKEN